MVDLLLQVQELNVLIQLSKLSFSPTLPPPPNPNLLRRVVLQSIQWQLSPLSQQTQKERQELQD